ncbi:assimilatory nitrite reductase (NAD(P)H) small subunit [Isoptericola jiangsuensis]|uniref:Assimilatory nitrite reductase (NAD(P)H) small subunit n=1 Tax=Isoptericola jiangsuensis TaxID=548579 RepID=A0A2A9F0F1_9MICO|nr:nitrite reductase small subunit NirD [Isoptericola jiangsuensis]PFG43909.1 assimilatory nitrite reductase (NAD(P)H) small subunit [Isoptericola jiangsuensis]
MTAVPATDADAPARPAADPTAVTWTAVCPLDALVPERGAAALLERRDGTTVQVALFRLLDDTVLAVQQLDPYSGAHVLSRGIVGTRGGAPTVAGPVYKQVFDLRTGRCLDTGGKSPRPGHDDHLEPFPVDVRDAVVHVGV